MASQKYLRPPEPFLTFHGSVGTISSLHAITIGPLEGHLISGSLQTTVYVWDLIRTKRLVTKFQCDENANKNSTILSTNSDHRKPDELLIQTREGCMHRWRLRDGKAQHLARTSTGSQLSFCPAVNLPEDDLLCVPSGEVSSNTSGVGLISQTDFSPVGLLYPGKNLGSPMRMVRIRDHEVLVAYENADLLLWDVRAPASPVMSSGIIKTSRDAEKEDDVTPLAMDVDREKGIVVVGGASNLVKRLKLGPAELSLQDSLCLAESGVADLRIRADGKIFTIASWDFTARVFSWKTRKPLAVLDLHRDSVQCVEYAKICDENFVVLGGKDSMISVWPLY